MNDDKGAGQIVTPGTGKTQERRYAHPEFLIAVGQLEKGIAEVVFIRSLSRPRAASESGK